MENNQQQYLKPETYLGIIQELSSTISNLNIELALAKVQYKEMTEYAQTLQSQLQQMSETANKEAIGAEANE